MSEWLRHRDCDRETERQWQRHHQRCQQQRAHAAFEDCRMADTQRSGRPRVCDCHRRLRTRAQMVLLAAERHLTATALASSI